MTTEGEVCPPDLKDYEGRILRSQLHPGIEDDKVRLLELRQLHETSSRRSKWKPMGADAVDDIDDVIFEIAWDEWLTMGERKGDRLDSPA